MTDRPYSEQTIGNLTRGQLEEIIKEIAEKTIKHEMINAQSNKARSLTATFGTWEDERSEEEIINEIYESRDSNLTFK